MKSPRIERGFSLPRTAIAVHDPPFVPAVAQLPGQPAGSRVRAFRPVREDRQRRGADADW